MWGILAQEASSGGIDKYVGASATAGIIVAIGAVLLHVLRRNKEVDTQGNHILELLQLQLQEERKRNLDQLEIERDQCQRQLAQQAGRIGDLEKILFGKVRGNDHD